MPLDTSDQETTRVVARWLLTGAGVALVMSVLKDILNSSEDRFLVVLARAGVNSLFSLAVGALVLRLWTVNVYELLIIVGIFGYLGADYALVIISRWITHRLK